MNSISRRHDSRSSDSSSANGVARIGITPRNAPLSCPYRRFRIRYSVSNFPRKKERICGDFSCPRSSALWRARGSPAALLHIVALRCGTGGSHVQQGRAADSPAELPGVPSAGRDRPDVVHDVQGRASVRPRHREGDHVEDDAAVVRGSVGRAFQEREDAHRRPDRHARGVGRKGRHRGRREGQTRAGGVRGRLDHRQARHHRQVSASHRDSGHRHRGSVQRAGIRALRSRHVGAGGAGAAGQSEGGASHEGVDSAARIGVDEGCAGRRALQSAAWPGRPGGRRCRKRSKVSASGIMPVQDILAKYNPGVEGQEFTEGNAAKFIAAGSDIVFESHYTTNGKPEVDQSTVGIVLAKAPPQQRHITTTAISERRFEIPAGQRQLRGGRRGDDRRAGQARLGPAAHALSRQGLRR